MPRAGTPVLALLALVALLAAPSLAAAAPRWLAPTELTPAGERASTPRVVIGPDGTSTAAWLAQTPAGGVVRVATRPPGVAAWPAPVEVSGPVATGVADLVVDAAGNVAVMWTTPAAGPGGTVGLQAAVRPPGGAFGQPEQITGPSASSLFLALAADGAGGFVAAWSTPLIAGRPSTAHASTRAPGGGWAPAETLSAPGDHALLTEASGAGGRVAVVWTGAPIEGGERAVRVRERPSPGAPWTAERIVSGSGGPILEPSVAVNPAGDLLVSWFTVSAAGSVVQAAFRPAAGDWGPPETLGPGGGFATPPKAVVEPDGTASVVWVDAGVVARVRAPGAGFGPEQRLANGSAVNLLPATLAAAGPAGGVIAAWAGGGALDGPNVVRAALKPPGNAPFGAVTTLSAPARVGGQTAALGPGGEAVAAWVASADAAGSAGVIGTADYTERPGAVLEPSPVAVRIDRSPRTAVQGSLARLRLAVEGFADGLSVRLQRRFRGGFRDTEHVVGVSGPTAELPVRLTAPGKLVVRLAYESRGEPAYSRAVAIEVTRPGRALTPAGTRPSRVAVGFGAVWVLTADDAGDEVVLRLDARTGRPNADPVPVDGAASLAVGAGGVWVSRTFASDRGIVRIDPAAAAVVAEIPLISSGALAAGPAGVWTVECVRTAGFAVGCGEQRLARIDPASNAVSERFTVVAANEESSPTASGLAVGARYVWFVHSRDKSSTTRRLDTRTGTIGDAGTGAGLVARGDVVWGLAGRTCRLVRGRGAGRLVDRGRVAGRPRFGCSTLDFDGRTVWVGQHGNTFGIDPAAARVPSRLVRLDARTGRPLGRPIALGLAPVAVDVGEGAIWAASGEEAVVRRIVPPRAGPRPRAVRPARAPVLRAAWRRPETVPGSTAGSVYSLDLATGDAGRAAAIWQARDGRAAPRIASSIRAAGAARWGTARRLATSATNPFGGRPHVEMNAAGEAVAVWPRTGAGTLAVPEAALLGARARAFGAPAVLGPRDAGGLSADVGIGTDGTAVATWSCLCTAGRGPAVMRSAVRPPGGAFGAATPMGSDGGALAIFDADLSLSPAGRAVAVWAPAPGGALIAASRAPGGEFGPPSTLVPPAVLGASSPRVAVNDAGRAVAVWQHDGIVAAVRGADGAWGPAERIAPPGRFSSGGAQVAIDADGNVLAVARAFDLETFNFRVMTIARRAGKRGWERPAWLSPKGPTAGPPGPSAGEPSLAMNARGDAVVAWPQRVGGRVRALARLRPAGRLAWRPLEAVSAPERGVGAVAAAMDADGAAAVGWVAQAGRGSAARQTVRVTTRPALRPAG